ncbi:hypothetical protein QQX98_000863 [Neonectria punicea]|uniref:Uncharacterized protein n=1 Tax=Neonectria punicea TaxID=979145 RepID=A0ABR1HR11_9HYPO
MQSNGEPTPPVPPDLRQDKPPGFDAKKVTTYRPVPCLRCARIMATAKEPGHFCFGYAEPGKKNKRCAHCVMQNCTCERVGFLFPSRGRLSLIYEKDEWSIKDEFKYAKELSLACVHWAMAMDSDTPPTDRPDAVTAAAKVITTLTKQSDASFDRQLARKPGEPRHPWDRSPKKRTGAEIAADVATAAVDDNDTDTDSEPQVATRDKENDYVEGRMEL